MKLRLITTLIVATALSGCATYDYAGGSAPGGYYYGRSAPSYYDDGYGYGYGGYYGYSPYYGYGGYPYYIYRPIYRPHRPHRPDHDGKPDPGDDRAPPWRNPVDGRYLESGRVKIPPQNRIPQSPGQPRVVGDGRQPSGNNGIRVRPSNPSNDAPRRIVMPAPAPRVVERSRPPVRSAPLPRTENRGRVRSEEP